MRYIKSVSLILLCLLVSKPSFSQVKAVLVKLYSENKRIKYFEQSGRQREASEIKRDAQRVMEVTINDFRDHFSAFPVYYFIDTNLLLVKSGELQGVLLDGDLQPVRNVNIKKGDDYRIVYYGVPGNEVSIDNGGVYMDHKYPGDGLVILGPGYKPVKGTDHFVYQNFLFSKTDKKYSYTSKSFGIGYRPFARFLQERYK